MLRTASRHPSSRASTAGDCRGGRPENTRHRQWLARPIVPPCALAIVSHHAGIAVLCRRRTLQMRVTPEAITVVPEPERGELAVIMAGLRITFSANEAELLARGLGQALARLGGNSEGSGGGSGDTAGANAA